MWQLLSDNSVIKNLVENQNFAEAENYLKEKILDKPQEFFTIDKLRKSLGIDRKLTFSELLLYVFGHINSIPTQKECLNEEFDKMDEKLKPNETTFLNAKEVFEAYSVDKEFRDIIDSGHYAELSVHPSGEAFKNLPPELKQSIPSFIKENVNLERLENVR